MPHSRLFLKLTAFYILTPKTSMSVVKYAPSALILRVKLNNEAKVDLKGLMMKSLSQA